MISFRFSQGFSSICKSKPTFTENEADCQSIASSFLRRLSKAAQAQVAKATAAGDEAVSNIRTVRAFAMEDEEMEVYGTELSKARQLNENLGLGIGLFQVRRT